jgi:hypothetical protein
MEECDRYNLWICSSYSTHKSGNCTITPTQLLCPSVSTEKDKCKEWEFWGKYINKETNNIDINKICLQYRRPPLRSHSFSSEMTDSEREDEVESDYVEEQRVEFVAEGESMQGTKEDEEVEENRMKFAPPAEPV